MAENKAPAWPNGSVDFDAAHKLAKAGQLNEQTVQECVVHPANPDADAPEAPAAAAKKKEG